MSAPEGCPSLESDRLDRSDERRKCISDAAFRALSDQLNGRSNIYPPYSLPVNTSNDVAGRTTYPPSHCTFAVTDAAAFSVNVQVLALFPPLEQAPDQMASRPFETVSVIEVPVVKGADPVVPTATLIPAGVEVTLSPLRPVAVTVSVAVWPGAGAGVTVNTALRVAPPKEPLIVDKVDAVTAGVLTVNVAVVAPAGTVTLAGTEAAAVLLLESDTTAPPAGAALVSVAVP